MRLYSPIEEALIDAMPAAFAAGGLRVYFCAEHDPAPRAGLRMSACNVLATAEHSKGAPSVLVCRQAKELGYVVDLMLRLGNLGSQIKNGFFDAVLAVECDGHDFHERTKQQAAYDRARDRELLIKRGLVTVRFAGSEIHRDANQCARECVEALLAIGAFPKVPQ